MGLNNFSPASVTSHLYPAAAVAASRANVVVAAGLVDHVTTYGLPDFAIVFRSVRPARFTVILAFSENAKGTPLATAVLHAPVLDVRSIAEPSIIIILNAYAEFGVYVPYISNTEVPSLTTDLLRGVDDVKFHTDEVWDTLFLM